jgi:hypothetical protein
MQLKKMTSLLGFDLGIRVWLVALARTKLVKETEPIGKSAGFSEYTQTSN